MGSSSPQSKTAERHGVSPPGSLAALLGEFRGCFSAWTFPVFCALACGLVSQTAGRTVCGMLVGAGLSQTWSHHRAHRFFSDARWSIEHVSAVLTRLVVRLLLADDAAVTIAIDDTLFHRRGPKVHAASWFHDGSAIGKAKVGYGNNWVILAIVVRLGFLDRPLALPVGFALVKKNIGDSSRLVLARRLVEALSAALPGRCIHVVADSAYAGKALRGLSGSVTWTTRLRSNASLYELAPPRTGRGGRPPGSRSKYNRVTAELCLPAADEVPATARCCEERHMVSSGGRRRCVIASGREGPARRTRSTTFGPSVGRVKSRCATRRAS